MAKDKLFEKPFDGAISRFAEKEAPKEIRAGAGEGRQGRHPRPALPLPGAARRRRLRGGLRALPARARQGADLDPREGQRIVIVFEGRDAAGKGGTIQAFTENLNPR